MRRLIVGAATACALAATGCGTEAEPVLFDEDAVSHVDTIGAAELDRLRSLPYLNSTRDADPELSGVTVNDGLRSQPGYNLYTIRVDGVAVLIDDTGAVLKTWEGGDFWVRSTLLPSGELLVVGTDGRDRYLAKYSWAGALMWKRDLAVHHDVSVGRDGTLLTLARARRTLPDLYPDHTVQDNPVLRLNSEGEVLSEWSLLDVMLSRPGALNAIRGAEDRTAIDLFHSNSVREVDLPELAGSHPIYSPANVVVSIRHQDRVIVFNWETGELVWEWGNGEVSGPHDAVFLATGNLLMFDNGLGRGWSRVIELDPRTEQIVWEYSAPELTDFYTATRGANQRLQNGNTLITESDSGHAFEVTPEGEIVWEYWVPPTPRRNADRWRRPAIVRLYRYSGEWLERLLAQEAE